LPPKRNVSRSLRTRRDLRKTYDWYEKERPGLGRRFSTAFVEAIDVAIERPTSFPISHKDVRRVILNTFPYGLFFRLIDGTVRVVGVVHLHRRPSAWRGRL